VDAPPALGEKHDGLRPDEAAGSGDESSLSTHVQELPPRRDPRRIVLRDDAKDRLGSAK